MGAKVDLSMKDKDFGYAHIPNAKGYYCSKEYCNYYQVNSEGFIGEEFSLKGNKRVLIFGDSFMEALQVKMNQSTPYLLEKSLKQINENYSTYNFGHSGYGTDQYYLGLKKYSQLYKPEIVIFSLNIGNDLVDINPELSSWNCRPNLRIIDDQLTRLNNACEEDSFFTKILRKSRLVKFVREKYAKIINERKYQIDNIPVNYYIFQENDSRYVSSFEINEKIILESKKIADQYEAEFILVLLPSKMQVDEDYWNNIIERYPEILNKSWNLNYPNIKIMDFCEKNKINCLDTLPSFKSGFENGKVLYYETETHFNAEGHKLFAEEILTFLKK